MNRFAPLAICVLLSGAAPSAQDDITAILGPKGADADLVPDKSWVPAVGDKVVVFEPAPAAPKVADLSEYVKYEKANDQTGKSKLVSSKRVVSLPKGTEVLILRVYRPAPSPVAGKGTERSEAIQRAVLSPDTNRYPVEVRVLGGPLKDDAVFLPDDLITKLTVRGEPDRFTILSYDGRTHEADTHQFVRPALGKKGAPPPDPKIRAASLVREGRKAETAGDVARAVNAYWFAVKDFTDTPSAAEAAKRLRGLGFYRTPDGRCEVDPKKRSKVK